MDYFQKQAANGSPTNTEILLPFVSNESDLSATQKTQAQSQAFPNASNNEAALPMLSYSSENIPVFHGMYNQILTYPSLSTVVNGTNQAIPLTYSMESFPFSTHMHNQPVVLQDQVGNGSINIHRRGSSSTIGSDNGSMSAIGIDFGSVSNLEDKRQKRLEKNRDIARNCRKRKKEKYIQLESVVNKLRAENEELQYQLKRRRNDHEWESSRRQAIQEIQNVLDHSSNDQDIQSITERYKEQFAEYGKERKAAVKYHLDQLKSLLLPSQVTKLCAWALSQSDDFFEDTSSTDSIWNIIVHAINITDEQRCAIQTNRNGFREQRTSHSEVLSLLASLRTKAVDYMDQLDMRMSTLMQNITPRQQAEFLLWVENNQACMHMLNYLWEQLPESRQDHDSTTETKQEPALNVNAQAIAMQKFHQSSTVASQPNSSQPIVFTASFLDPV